MARVTPPGAFRKMNSDNNACSTLTSNLMNMINIRLDMFSFMQIHVRRAIHEVMPMTVLEFPRSSGLGSCLEYVMIRPRYV